MVETLAAGISSAVEMSRSSLDDATVLCVVSERFCVSVTGGCCAVKEPISFMPFSAL